MTRGCPGASSADGEGGKDGADGGRQGLKFDGSAITVRRSPHSIWNRHGGRKVIIAPDGGDGWCQQNLGRTTR